MSEIEHAFEDCGTYAAYQRHKKRGIPVDDDCKAALREYMKEYRETHPATLKRDRRVATARSRALARLANAHPGEYSRLLLEERQRVLNPSKTDPDFRPGSDNRRELPSRDDVALPTRAGTRTQAANA